MPKKQSTAGQKARLRQREAGEKYTKALRHIDSSVYVLAQALRAAGLVAEAADLTALLAEWAATAPLQRAFEAVDAARYNAPDDISDAERERLELASREAWAAVEQSWADDEPLSGSRRELVAVFAALAHVGRHDDRHGLAQAAVGALAPWGEREDGRLWGSDAIRSLRQLPGFDDAPVEGPDTPTAAAARAAAQTLAQAARIPFKGDEEWIDCAVLIGEAFQLARAAASQ